MLEKFPAFESENPEVVRASLEQMVGLTRFDIVSDERFVFRANKFQLDELSLGWYFDGSGTRCDFAEQDVAKQLICIRGAYQFELGDRSEASNRVRWSALVPPYIKHSLAAEPYSELLSLRIENSAILRKIAAISGEMPTTAIRFTADKNIDLKAMETLRRTVLYFVGELCSDHADYLSVAKKELQELLIVSFLFAHEHNFSPMLSRKRVLAPANSQLHRVEDYIAANFAKPIGVEELSAITGTSVRSLFRHFKRLRGLTPAEFIKQVRLEASRQMLLAADERTSVMEVALKCGFHSHGHFAREYKCKFFELPSETLGRRDKSFR